MASSHSLRFYLNFNILRDLFSLSAPYCRPLTFEGSGRFDTMR